MYSFVFNNHRGEIEMLKKSMLCVAALAMVIAFGFTPKAQAEDKGPETVVLKTAKGKKPALFPHRSHQTRLDCKTCHEDANFSKDANGWTKKQGHALCKDCHKKHKADGASTKCSNCHKKGLK